MKIVYYLGKNRYFGHWETIESITLGIGKKIKKLLLLKNGENNFYDWQWIESYPHITYEFYFNSLNLENLVLLQEVFEDFEENTPLIQTGWHDNFSAELKSSFQIQLSMQVDLRATELAMKKLTYMKKNSTCKGKTTGICPFANGSICGLFDSSISCICTNQFGTKKEEPYSQLATEAIKELL